MKQIFLDIRISSEIIPSNGTFILLSTLQIE
jgi:hypothetical protein